MTAAGFGMVVTPNVPPIVCPHSSAWTLALRWRLGEAQGGAASTGYPGQGGLVQGV